MIEEALTCVRKLYAGCPESVLGPIIPILNRGMENALGAVALPCPTDLTVELLLGTDPCPREIRCSVNEAMTCIIRAAKNPDLGTLLQ